MKKMFTKLAGLVLATTLLLGGCGSADTSPTEPVSDGNALTVPSAEGTVNLRLWGAEEDAELLAKIITNFKAAYPDVDFNITVEPMPESQCRDHVLDDVVNAPDLFTFADDQLSALASSGVLAPVTNSDDVAKRNTEGSVSAASVNGVLYAYPLTADNGYFMFYNKAYFTDADLQTLEGMLAVAAANGKKVTLDMTSGWYLYTFFGNTGLTITLNEDGISNFCDWNSTSNKYTGVDVVNGMLAIANTPGFMNGGDSVLTEGAANDTVIAGVSGIWLANTMREAWGNNYGAVKLPTYTVKGSAVQMSSYAGYKMVGVNSYSENIEWASLLADYITNEENQTLRFTMRAQGPSNTNAAASSSVSAEPAIQALIQQSAYASLQRVGGNYWAPASELGSLVATGSMGGANVQDYLDSIVGRITASY